MKTGRSRRKMNKTIRVESNDPQNPVTYLRVKAFVEAEIGDEEISVNMGNVKSHSQTIKNVSFYTGKARNIVVDSITSSSDFVSGRVVPPVDSTSKARPDSINLQIVVDAGLEPGLMSEKVVAHFKDGLRSRINYFLYGIIVDDIEVSPLNLSYIVTDSDENASGMKKKLIVTNYIEDWPLEITEVKTPGNHLQMTVQTIEEGKKFEITAVANENAMAVESTLESMINISTNNPEFPSIEVPFRVMRR